MIFFLKNLGRNLLSTFKRMIKRLYDRIIWGRKRPKKDEIIYINPHLIKGHLLHSPGWKKLTKKTGCQEGVILGGNWDLNEVEYLKIKETDYFQSCLNHWHNGLFWEGTPYFKQYLKKINSGIPCRFKNISELENRYLYLDHIYDQIKQTGKMSLHSKDLIIINISRDGSLIWGPDGKHRICIALCLGLKKIPARIGFIHSEAVEQFQQYRINGFSSNLTESIYTSFILNLLRKSLTKN